MARRKGEDDRLPAITYGLLGVFAFGFILTATELPVVKYIGVVLATTGLLGYALGRTGSRRLTRGYRHAPSAHRPRRAERAARASRTSRPAYRTFGRIVSGVAYPRSTSSALTWRPSASQRSTSARP
jgi:hypothetical protein